MNYIRYRGGYKYQLGETYRGTIPIHPDKAIETEYISLGTDGSLTIQEGYAWDGPSGPTIDTANFMRGSLVHDALYQLMREGYLDHNQHRDPADRVLQAICIEDGMSRVRAQWVYYGVHFFGDPAADPASRVALLTAPSTALLNRGLQ